MLIGGTDTCCPTNTTLTTYHFISHDPLDFKHDLVHLAGVSRDDLISSRVTSDISDEGWVDYQLLLTGLPAPAATGSCCDCDSDVDSNLADVLLTGFEEGVPWLCGRTLRLRDTPWPNMMDLKSS